MLAALQMEKAELSLVLTDDKEIHHLNKVYRRKDRPTDVLAFSLREGEAGDVAGELLGDVIVSIPTARKQARTRGKDVLEEVTMLTAHGLLHLLGWDHATDEEEAAMTKETARLCSAAAPAPVRRRARAAGHGSSASRASKATRARGSVASSPSKGATKTRARRQKITS